MSLIAISEVPANHQQLLFWSFNHMGHHRDVNQAIFQVFGLSLEEFPLDPFDPKDISRVWGQQHQIMHNAVNSILGVAGNDLTEVNWNDKGEREAWIFLDFTEHQQWSDALGV